MKQLEVGIYVAGKTITLEGADNSDRGMFVLDCGVGDITMVRMNEREFAEYIVSELKDRIKPKLVDSIHVNYNCQPKNVSHSADGYFGRPKIFYATTKLNPLDKRKMDNLRKALRKIGSIEIEGGKKIELIT